MAEITHVTTDPEVISETQCMESVQSKNQDTSEQPPETKRRRLTNATDARVLLIQGGVANQSVPRRNNFLTTLSVDDETKLIQHLSEEPFRDDWASYMNPETLILVLQLFPRAFQFCFDSICDQGATCYECGTEFWSATESSWFKCNKTYLSKTACTSHIMQLCESVMPRFKNATLCKHLSGPDVGALAHRLIGITSLKTSIDCTQTSRCIISACGRQLKKLTICINSVDVARVVALKCTQLRSLDIHTLDINCLRSVLLAIGHDLTELSACLHSNQELDIIRNNCPGLKSIILYATTENIMSAYAEFLASYGKQLCHARADYFNDHQARMVMASCPNAEIIISETDNTLWFPFKKQLALLHVTQKTLASDLFTSLRQCTNIRELDLAGFLDEPSLINLRGVRFNSLKCLKLFNDVEAEADGSHEIQYKVFALFASCTGNLERLHVSLDVMRYNIWKDGFEKLVTSNQKLTHAAIEVFNVEKYHWSHEKLNLLKIHSSLALAGLTKFFSTEPCMRELIIESISGEDERWARSPAISAALVGTARFRQMHIRVLEHVYLPVGIM